MQYKQDNNYTLQSLLDDAEEKEKQLEATKQTLGYYKIYSITVTVILALSLALNLIDNTGLLIILGFILGLYFIKKIFEY